MKNSAYLLLAGLAFLISCSTSPKQRSEDTPAPEIPKIESIEEVHELAPPVKNKKAIVDGNTVTLDHKFFVISYNTSHRLANWVSYELTAEHLKNKKAKRRNKFYPDPLLEDLGFPVVKNADYAKTGYQKGHMAPSEDFVWSQEANDTTFVLTNMAPQRGALNTGSWKTLERKVRLWACTEGKVRVITGPIITKKLALMKARVSIPEKFFKIVLDETAPRKAIAFVYAQTDTKVKPAERAVSVSEVEALTGGSYLNDLSARDLGIKKKFDISDWKETNCMKKVAGK